MNFSWDTLFKFGIKILGLFRGKPQVDAGAQKIKDIAKAKSFEAKHENKEGDRDWKTEEEKNERDEKREADRLGIRIGQYRKLEKESKLKGIPIDELWEDHWLHKRLLEKIKKKKR